MSIGYTHFRCLLCLRPVSLRRQSTTRFGHGQVVSAHCGVGVSSLGLTFILAAFRPISTIKLKFGAYTQCHVVWTGLVIFRIFCLFPVPSSSPHSTTSAGFIMSFYPLYRIQSTYIPSTPNTRQSPRHQILFEYVVVS